MLELGRIWWSWIGYGGNGSSLVEMDQTTLRLGSNIVELGQIW